MPVKGDIDEELQKSLKDIVKSCKTEDDEIYKAMQRQWKKYEEFWHGVQYLFWSERDNSWRSPADWSWNNDDSEATDQVGSFEDKVVDIFRGHGESIISALAAQIPSLRFIPDDADEESDVITARTKSKIADLVQRHNKAKLIFLRALFYLALHGVVASYRYAESDFKYGSYSVPKYEQKENAVTTFVCPICNYQSDTNWQDNPEDPAPCPQCGSMDAPQPTVSKQKVPVQVGEQTLPKTRVKVEVFGALHWKVSYYARNQAECSYFLLFGDLGKDVVKSQFEDLEDEIEAETISNLDRFARSDYMATVDPELGQNNLVTVTKAWLRPEAFFREKKKSLRKKLQKKFPSGCKVTLIGKNDHFAEAVEEKLDDRWRIGQAGLSTYIYSDPFLRPLVQIQEMRNQLVNLIIETIEHGIPSDFADPKVLNFDTYGKYEAVPGYVYKCKSRAPGEPIGNAFYSTTRATLSKEVGAFLKQLDQDAQFSVGSFPSIYGGPAEGKTRTFSEYDASRQMALQRLSIIWHMTTDWWLQTIEGLVELFVDTMVEDEKLTKFSDGGYVTAWIHKSELQGKTGGVEPEASESFPVSLSQKKSLIMNLIQLNNQFIDSVLYMPDNARIIQDVLALTELKIPGESQRIKQCIENNQLLKEAPISETLSSIPPDPDIDDHAVHIAALKSFMVDLPGIDAAQRNPEGFANLKAHLKQHEMFLVMKTMQAGATPAGVPPPTAQGAPEE